MSIAILASRAQLGVDAPPVTIEVFLSGGLPRFNVVGMPETAVRESSDRVRGAIISSGFPFPRERITVSLAPADMRKTGGRFDLAIALGILAAQKVIPQRSLEGIEFYGELSLTGDLRSVPGILPAALRAGEAGNTILVPSDNADEASLTQCDVRAASNLGPRRSSRGRDCNLAPRLHLYRTSTKFAANRPPSERSRSPRPEVTTCCSSVHPGRARACSRGVCPEFCRR
jgi:hypothetical protein